jgi:hypothetical protein
MAESLEALLRACTVRVLGGPMSGAGFFIAPRTVVTCAHVIGDSDELRVKWERDWASPVEAPVSRRIVSIRKSRGWARRRPAWPFQGLHR